MQPSNEQKLKAAMKAEISAAPNLSDLEHARSLIKAEPALIADWVEETLTARFGLLHRRRPVDPAQMFLSFEELAVEIPLKKGAVEFRAATLGMLREAEKVLIEKQRSKIGKGRANSLLGKIQREIELMEPYVYRRRKLNVGQVEELRAAGRLPSTAPRSSAMSDAMKRYGEGKSPDERAAIARRREVKKAARKKAQERKARGANG